MSAEKKSKIDLNTLYYVDPKKLSQAIVDYKKAVKVSKREKKEKPPIPTYIGDSFFKIATRLSYRPNFIGYSFREDMVMDGVENCLKYFENFDSKKVGPKSNKDNNAFNYITQIVWWAFCRRIAQEKKQQYIKFKSLQQNIIHDGNIAEDDYEAFSDDTRKRLMAGESLFENINNFIAEFEKKKDTVAKEKKRLKSLT